MKNALSGGKNRTALDRHSSKQPSVARIKKLLDKKAKKKK